MLASSGARWGRGLCGRRALVVTQTQEIRVRDRREARRRRQLHDGRGGQWATSWQRERVQACSVQRADVQAVVEETGRAMRGYEPWSSLTAGVELGPGTC